MATQLLNTLYVQTQGTYLRLEGETLVAEVEDRKQQVPLHHLGGLVVFGNVLVSPFLLARCARDGRSLVWCSRSGRFEGRLAGPVSGNVLLRRAQHEALEDAEWSVEIARQVVRGKVRAQRMVLARAARRDGAAPALQDAAEALTALGRQARDLVSVEQLRGVEGQAAAVYFAHFDALIRADGFSFSTRTRRPPLDPVNALLSFLYSLLTRECEAALESVGLDPQVGFLHVLRPGRPALALDLVEEFRPWWGDRLALRLINRQQIRAEHFEPRPGGAVYLSEEGRKTVLTAHQERKQEPVRHRLFEHPIPAGLVPFVQARLLARHLRGDLDAYPPFRTR